MESRQRTYRKVLEVSQRVSWRLEDVLPAAARFDLERPLLPEALAQVSGLTSLSRAERRTLNHIRAHSYLCLFGLVEEFILPFVTDHARSRFGAAGSDEVRALLGFAGEEAKHIQLFKLFTERFGGDFGRACPVIGPAASIGEAVLSHQPLGVALIILHIEWMTQRHYVDAVKSGEDLDPLFAGLLEQHWLEEAQHARLDALIVEMLAERATAADVQRGIADYHRITALLESGLRTQVELDLETLQAATGRELARGERQSLRAAQERAYRHTFVESGADHPRFVETYAALSRL